ncbi:hypothetical protein DM860_008249 [Cuscuta australis]|uniref:Piwi domain-containing protein n=1 Tax=Cuscuta australis TaxID=267555 RepID=A0A328D6Y6_9ASTE|nr:hypothetical protein DM860_008249 [Cuscuta australis]
MEDEPAGHPSNPTTNSSRTKPRNLRQTSGAIIHHNPSNNIRFGFQNQNLSQNYPPLLPLPLQFPLPHPHSFRSKLHFHNPPPFVQVNPPFPTPSGSLVQDFSASSADSMRALQINDEKQNGRMKVMAATPESMVMARRPDSGGVEGHVIPLLANHFLVQFDPSQRIFHYDVEISPTPSKEIARMIKKNIVENHSSVVSGFNPVYDGRRTIYSPVEFQDDRIELYINLPLNGANSHKMFKVNIKLVSKLDGMKLKSYLNNEGDRDEWTPLPQEYLHALDVVLRESPTEKCLASGKSFYSSSMGGAEEIGGGAVALRGFFQSLRPTKQGLSLNVDLSVTAFHESIGVIPYLEKRLNFLHNLLNMKTKKLTSEERKEVEKALKNIRVFVCHRETVQKYRIYSLTEDITEDLWLRDRDGTSKRLVNYFKDHYNYDIQFKNLPCLVTSRGKPCYLPMELCVICEGQKFLGQLSDAQTARILKMGCRRPRERKAIIDGVMTGPVGPTSGNQGEKFKIRISREMTRLQGRIFLPPRLKLGDHGHVKNLVPSRRDRQWNLLEGHHVFEGTRVERWALISFGGTHSQKSHIPKFVNQLSQKCEQLGIFLNKTMALIPQFEPMHLLNNAKQLESKLKKMEKNHLQLLICVMEKKHKGYGDLKRIAETGIGVVSQCCLYPNLVGHSSHFLTNLALKINAKLGGSTVVLLNPLPAQVPRLFKPDDPVIFMGADVTHPHPLDDSSPSVAAVVGSLNWPESNKYASRMRSQTHRQEIIEDLNEMVSEILDDFYDEMLLLPKRIIFFRDGVSESQFARVLQEELKAIRTACSRFPGYKPPITFAVVQKRHHTRLFPADELLKENNVPPGTVVDTVITHPTEFDFYLCSHWGGAKGTSRPVHYHVLWDENRFTSDELQRLVYNLCYTSVRCTKPVSLVPPVYYAHLAAYRGRLYLQRPTNSGVTRAAPSKTMPLPQLADSIRKLMFYC